MKGSAPGLIDWSAAVSVGRAVAGAGSTATPEDRQALRDDLADSVARAGSLVADVTGLSVRGPATRAWVLGRGDWIEANCRSLERSIEPIIVRAIAAQKGKVTGTFRTRTLGAQLGGLFGYVSRKVLGQFDPFLPPDDEGLIYFVGPNVLDTERRAGLDPRDFRLWIALHEVTHRVQFANADWLRGYLLTMIDTYLQQTHFDPQRIMENLRRLTDEVRSGSQARSLGLMYAIMTPEQRDTFHRMQGAMSLLEGHASFVMNAAGERVLADLPRMKQVLNERRRAGGLERVFQQAIGFDRKLEQYTVGEAFVARVVERAGMEALNRAWATPANLPGAEELGEPDRWLARVV